MIGRGLGPPREQIKRYLEQKEVFFEKIRESLLQFDRLYLYDQYRDLWEGQRIDYSQEGEFSLLRRLGFGSKKGTYIDIGCGHPKFHSTTYGFYLLGWSGFCVDANVDLVEPWRVIRPRDTFLPKAIGATNTWQPYYKFEKPALNTFIKSVADLYQRNGNVLVENESVEIHSLNDILSNYKDNNIDILTIDVEGMDQEIVRSLDFKTFRPRAILFESLQNDLKYALDFPEIELMRSYGYFFKSKLINSILYLKEDWQ